MPVNQDKTPPGAWYVKACASFVSPWWDKYVGRKAESIATKRTALEIVVRFRVRDYCRGQKTAPQAEIGISASVIARMAAYLGKNPDTDITASPFVQLIEDEIQLAAVANGEWIKLACLSDVGNFDPQGVIAVEFIEGDGTTNHASSQIASLQLCFPFSRVFVINNQGIAQISAECTRCLAEYTQRTVFPEVRYEVRSGHNMSSPYPALSGAATMLPEGWRPK